jgi:phosphoadenosine phosphosulfate reductase
VIAAGNREGGIVFSEPIRKIETRLEAYQRENAKLFLTSSFQTQSLPLLHIIARFDRAIPVYFINTGFHFPEMLSFRDEIAKEFSLNLKILSSPSSRSSQIVNGRFMFTNDTDHCCYLNKIQPLEAVLAQHDVWINGIRRDQSQVRSDMEEVEKAPFDSVRYHPMLHWNRQMVESYIRQHRLRRHPLEASGFSSIGCEPCTQKVDLELMADERYARWFGQSKVECGLHTELVKK